MFKFSKIEIPAELLRLKNYAEAWSISRVYNDKPQSGDNTDDFLAGCKIAAMIVHLSNAVESLMHATTYTNYDFWLTNLREKYDLLLECEAQLLMKQCSINETRIRLSIIRRNQIKQVMDLFKQAQAATMIKINS